MLYGSGWIWMDLDESGLAGARTPKETCSHRNAGSDVPRFPSLPSVPWFRGYHRNEGLVGSGSSSDGSDDEGFVSFEGFVVPLFRCFEGSVLQLFRYFHYVRTRTSSRGVGGFYKLKLFYKN